MPITNPSAYLASLEHLSMVDRLEKLVTIFNTLREIIFTVDIERGVIEDVNNSIETLGYTKADWEQQHFKDWSFSKRKEFHFLIKHASTSKIEATSQQILFPTKDKSVYVPFEFSTAVYHIKNKKYLLCVLRDVTEREKLLAEVQQALAKEKQVNALRNIFISTASHQFRTPLTIIQSSLDLMDLYVEDLTTEQSKPFKKQFKRIIDEIERLQSLMNDVLLLGRADANRTPFKPILADIVAFCNKIAKEKYNNRYEANRQVLIEVQGKPVKVEFDTKLLDHAFENILSNAYKYSSQGNIKVLIQFNNSTVQINISDNGIGIPDEDVPNMFTAFYRSSNTDDFEGTGLGLAIVKEFIEAHGGKISAQSEINKGTTISVLLPLSQQPK
jgi:PAS domain S-box-containing protein